MKLSELNGLGSATGLIGRIKELYTLYTTCITDILGTTDEVEVIDNGDQTYTIGLPDSVVITLDLTVGNDLQVNNDASIDGDVYLKADKKLYFNS